MGKPWIHGRNWYNRKEYFRVVNQIQLEEIQEQAHGYFGLLGNGNFVNPLPIPLEVSSLTHLSYNDITQANEMEKFLIGCDHTC